MEKGPGCRGRQGDGDGSLGTATGKGQAGEMDRLCSTGAPGPSPKKAKILAPGPHTPQTSAPIGRARPH